MSGMRAAKVLIGVLGAVLLTACGGSGTPTQVTVTAPPETVTATPTPEAPAESTPATSETPAEPEEPAESAVAETFVMPKVTGLVLQDAQDLLQTLGSYLMDQQDASGLARLQIDDSNWKVCAQAPKAGSKVPIETIVVLKAVKLRESCP